MKFVKIAGTLLSVILLLIMVIFLWLDESKPVGKDVPGADSLARKMMQAVNYPAWDTTRFVSWKFPGGHSYVWDKARKVVSVSWDEWEVVLRTEDQSGMVFRDGKPISGSEKSEILSEAWKYFCNDSFWLNPVAKLFDPGTSRRLVELEDGSTGLMVTYHSGGVTPGDSYLWKTNASHLPVSWKLWVSVIPIGGLEFSWEEWTEPGCGALISKEHKTLMGFGFALEDIRCGRSLDELGIRSDPFSGLPKVIPN